MSKTSSSALNAKVRGNKVFLSDDDKNLISTALSLIWIKTNKRIESCIFDQDRARITYKNNEGRMYFDLKDEV